MSVGLKEILDAIEFNVADSCTFSNDQFSHQADAYDAGVADAIEAVKELFDPTKD